MSYDDGLDILGATGVAREQIKNLKKNAPTGKNLASKAKKHADKAQKLLAKANRVSGKRSRLGKAFAKYATAQLKKANASEKRAKMARSAGSAVVAPPKSGAQAAKEAGGLTAQGKAGASTSNAAALARNAAAAVKQAPLSSAAKVAALKEVLTAARPSTTSSTKPTTTAARATSSALASRASSYRSPTMASSAASMLRGEDLFGAYSAGADALAGERSTTKQTTGKKFTSAFLSNEPWQEAPQPSPYDITNADEATLATVDALADVLLGTAEYAGMLDVVSTLTGNIPGSGSSASMLQKATSLTMTGETKKLANEGINLFNQIEDALLAAGAIATAPAEGA